MRIGLWGAGGIARVHARHFGRIEGVERVAFDLDAERAAQIGRAAGSEAEFLELADAVVVALPTDLHAEVGEKVLRAGKPVLLEKPMAGSVAECDRLIAAAEETGGMLVPAQVVRFFADYAAANRLVREGAVGTPSAIRLRRGGKAPMGTGGWFRDPQRSGGVIMDLAVHDLDWLLWTFGAAEAVSARSVWIGGAATPEECGDHAVITVSFASGAVGHVEATWNDPSGFRATIEVAGSGGLIQYDSRECPTVRTLTDGAPRNEAPMAADDDPFYRQARAFVAAVRGEAEPAVRPAEGRAAVALAAAALESARTGRLVRL